MPGTPAGGRAAETVTSVAGYVAFPLQCAARMWCMKDMQEPARDDTTRLEKQRHFIRAMSKSLDGRVVSESEHDLLDSIFGSLLLGKDVFGMIGVQRPHNRRPGDPIYIAVHYLCLRKLMHERPDKAWHIVAEAWGLKRRQVRWVIANNRVPALKVLERFGTDADALLRLCEWRAQGDRKRASAGAGAGVTVSEKPKRR